MVIPLLLALTLAAQTEQTVQVQKDTRLDVQSPAGTVTVTVWNRDAVRIEAQHESRDSVEVRTGPSTVSVQGRSRSGRPMTVALTVPSWMPIRIASRRAHIDLTGVGSDVAVETLSGSIVVRGGAGRVYAKSLQGSVTIENARAAIEAQSTNARVRLSNVVGDIDAESTNGSIQLEKVDSANMDVSTVNGSITFEGLFKDQGSYHIATHNGSMSFTIPGSTNATLRVRTYQGTFRSTFPVRLDNATDRGRINLTLGNGSARVELESFNGSISLRRPEDPVPSENRNRNRNR